MDTPTAHVITYTFVFPDGRARTFKVELDLDTLHLLPHPRPAPPAWTRLETFRCSHCPLKAEEHPHCPVAVNLVDLLSFFAGTISHETADITIESPERTVWKTASVQSGVSSLIGIYMVTSGCPVMDKLKPMVRFHLPFATMDETAYRALAMYTLAQFFVQREGGTPDWSLKGLADLYEDVHVVNVNFCNQLQSLRVKDASLNALSILDSFASFTSFSINNEMLDEVRKLFTAYLKPLPPPEAP